MELSDAIELQITNNDAWFNTSALYWNERSDYDGKYECSNRAESLCNDGVWRTTTWDGFIGLMYPSDYGYAVGGDERGSCLARSMAKWSENSPDCKGNDWLLDSISDQWTITPANALVEASNVFSIYSDGSVYSWNASTARAVRPTAYLKSSIKIQEKSDSDYGSQGNPFVLEGIS